MIKVVAFKNLDIWYKVNPVDPAAIMLSTALNDSGDSTIFFLQPSSISLIRRWPVILAQKSIDIFFKLTHSFRIREWNQLSTSVLDLELASPLQPMYY